MNTRVRKFGIVTVLIVLLELAACSSVGIREGTENTQQTESTESRQREGSARAAAFAGSESVIRLDCDRHYERITSLDMLDSQYLFGTISLQNKKINQELAYYLDPDKFRCKHYKTRNNLSMYSFVLPDDCGGDRSSCEVDRVVEIEGRRYPVEHGSIYMPVKDRWAVRTYSNNTILQYIRLSEDSNHLIDKITIPGVNPANVYRYKLSGDKQWLVYLSRTRFVDEQDADQHHGVPGSRLSVWQYMAIHLPSLENTDGSAGSPCIPGGDGNVCHEILPIPLSEKQISHKMQGLGVFDVHSSNNRLNIAYVENAGSPDDIDTDIILVTADIDTNRHRLVSSSKKNLSDYSRNAFRDGYDSMPVFLGNGEWIAFVRQDDRITDYSTNYIRILDLDHNGNSVTVSVVENGYRFDDYIHSIHGSCNDDCLLVNTEVRGNTAVKQLDLNRITRKIEKESTVLSLDGMIETLVPNGDGKTLYSLASRIDTPPALYKFGRTDATRCFSGDDGQCRVELTRQTRILETNKCHVARLNSGMENIQCRKDGNVNKFNFFTEDVNEHYNDGTVGQVDFEVRKVDVGNNRDIEVFVIGSRSSGVRRKALLLVHGGPNASWKNRFDPSLVPYILNDYILVLPNPAGSIGYGQDEIDLSRYNWGTTIYSDIVAVAEKMASGGLSPDIDSARMALAGASFGGYMAALFATRKPEIIDDATGEQHEFKTYISVDGIYNTDIWRQNTIERWYGVHQLENTGDEHNPSKFIANSGKADPPVLLLAGNSDIVVKSAQSSAFHDALNNACAFSMLALTDKSHGFRPVDHIVNRALTMTWLDWVFGAAGDAVSAAENTQIVGELTTAMSVQNVDTSGDGVEGHENQVLLDISDAKFPDYCGE